MVFGGGYALKTSPLQKIAESMERQSDPHTRQPCPMENIRNCLLAMSQLSFVSKHENSSSVVI